MQVLFEDFNLTEGLNLGVSQYLNKTGEAREAIGCDFKVIGELARHSGYEAYGSGLAAAAVTGLYDFNTTAGVKKWLAKAGTKLYYDNAGTLTDTGASLTSGVDVTFATHLDTVIVGGASDAPLKSTNGTAFSSLGGTPPTAAFWVTFNNSVYALNLSGFSSRMRWSDDGTIETWTSTNVQDITTNIGIGDEITGATVNNNNLLIFKNYSTWKWDAAELRVLHANAGNRARKSIVTIDDWTFWMSHKGIMATNGGKPFRISNPMQPFIDAIPDITKCVGWAEDNILYMYIGTVTVFGQTILNCVVIYDYDNNTWAAKPLNDVVKQAAVLTTAAGARNVYLGNDNGQLYKFNTGNNDNLAAIPFSWKSSPYMSGYAHLEKTYSYLYVYLDRTAKTGIDVFYSIDFQDWEPLGTATNVVSKLTFPNEARGHNIRICYATDTTNSQQNILGHTCLGEIMPGILEDVV